MRRIAVVVARIVAAVVVAAAVAAIVIGVRSSEQPPPAAAGTARLAPPPQDGVPEIPLRVATTDGVRFLYYGGVLDGGRTARIGVSAGQDDSHPVRLTVTAGESTTVDGIELTLVHAWSMPNPAHDAIDVRAVPAP